MAGLSGLLLREWYTRDTELVQKAEEGPSVNVYFNDLRPLIRSTQGPDDRYFEAPEIINTVEGFPVYAGGYMKVITKRGKPLFTPISEEAILLIQYNNWKKAWRHISNWQKRDLLTSNGYGIKRAMKKPLRKATPGWKNRIPQRQSLT